MAKGNHEQALRFARRITRRGTNREALNLARAYLDLRATALPISAGWARTRHRIACLKTKIDLMIAQLDAE